MPSRETPIFKSILKIFSTSPTMPPTDTDPLLALIEVLQKRIEQLERRVRLLENVKIREKRLKQLGHKKVDKK